MTAVTLYINGEKATRVYTSTQGEINTLVAGWSKLLEHLRVRKYSIRYTLNSKYEAHQTQTIPGDAPGPVNPSRALCLASFYSDRSY